MELFSFSLVLLYAIVFGSTMKIADLLDEHGVKLFKGDALLFGLLWGVFGGLLILSRGDVANLLLARILAYLPRNRLDYVNHGIAGVIIILTFIWKAAFLPMLFFLFFAIFLGFGFLRDHFGNKRQKKDLLFALQEPAFYYIIPTFFYSLWIGDSLVFLVFALSQVSYNLVKYGFYFAGWSKEV